MGKLTKRKDKADTNKREFKKTEPPKVVTGEQNVVEPSLVDNISNEGIKFHADYFEQQTALGIKKFGRSFYVKPSGYPSNVRINWLEGLFTGDDMDVSVHIEPYDRTDAVRKLKDKADEYEAVMYSAEKQNDINKIEAVRQNYWDAKGLRDEIRNNSNGLFYVSISATVYADSLAELNDKSVAIERSLAAESIELVNSFDRQRESWLSTLPLGSNYLKKSYRNLDRNSLTAVFPHMSSKLNHDGGIPIGVYKREYIYFNNFDKKLTNYNLGIFGESGAGKGVFVKQLIGRGFMDGIEKVVIMDVEPEYVGLTYALGGIVIDLRSDSVEIGSKINPLDIYVEKEIVNRYQADEYVIERVNVNEKVKEVIEFFKVMKESASHDRPHLTPYELNALDRILLRLYRNECKITEDPESLYEYIDSVQEDGRVEYIKKYKRMPQISDVDREVKKLIKEGEKGLEELESVIALFVKGRAYGMFDCQTQIYDKSGEILPEEMLDKSQIVNFNISNLSKSGIERPLAQHVLMTWIWNRFIVNDPKPKKRVIQDEAWMMLEYPSMIKFFKTLSARGRKWNVSLTLVSQRYEMFDRTKEAQDVVAQLHSCAFMKQPDQDVEPILRTFRFSEEVGRMIRTADTGEVILKAGKEIVSFMSTPTPSEWKYINTNQNITVDSLVRGG
ncbi:DUF87 domain-containing protein [Lysinibacillus xylanilyticus]|uniref:VirB4 family type IV secretion system protein n=1 Tax=Lysinibacillus xylanilyticus TaxID=582475 RepID=UPI002B24A6C5|nr:DUF87 domain-containing protein [Lysinibacillus xylanilyticus]MEB2280112.1 DUF87 domain-containing protein [Lysinibacillus xylanilyticus]